MDIITHGGDNFNDDMRLLLSTSGYCVLRLRVKPIAPLGMGSGFVLYIRTVTPSCECS